VNPQHHDPATLVALYACLSLAGSTCLGSLIFSVVIIWKAVREW
jgi:hypothetical protein